MKYYFSFLLFIFCHTTILSQYRFSGKVNDHFINATAYLSIVEDCSKKDFFLTQSILKECKINENGFFAFEGNSLSNKNRIYKIHIDNCNNSINDYKHYLNQCADSKEILFIAKNKDTLYFPLNGLSQIFCNIEKASAINNSIFEIDNLHEFLLNALTNSKNERQRKLIYYNHFKKLQEFSKQFNEPLAELYAFYLYENEASLSRNIYLNDLKKGTYYYNLLSKLKMFYGETPYYTNYKNALERDQYPLLQSKMKRYRKLMYLFISLLGIAMLFIFYQVNSKNKFQNVTTLKDYKQILTPQEQKVFELMQNNSNKQIAEILFISLSTVKTHINNIYSKLNIKSRKEIKPYF